jgi:phage terminase small subunit
VDPKLTVKQARFVDEYMIDGNASQAAARAGYSKHTAFRIGQENMQKPAIRDEIAIRRALLSEKTLIDAGYVLRQAQKLHERCMAEDTFNAAGAAKALEIIGKHTEVQAFLERRDITSSDGSMTPTKIERIVVVAREDA